jgi:hypothetical protein
MQYSHLWSLIITEMSPAICSAALRALFIHNKLEIYTFEIIHSQLLIYFPHLINLNQYRTQQVHAISARGLEIVWFPIPLLPGMVLFTSGLRSTDCKLWSGSKMIEFLKLKYNLHLEVLK